MKGLPIAVGIMAATGVALALFASSGFGMRESNAPPVLIDGPPQAVATETESNTTSNHPSELSYDEFGPDPTLPLSSPSPTAKRSSQPAPDVRVRAQRMSEAEDKTEGRIVANSKPNELSRRTRSARNERPRIRREQRQAPRDLIVRIEEPRRERPQHIVTPPSPAPQPDRLPRDERYTVTSPRQDADSDDQEALQKQIEADREWRRGVLGRWEKEERERRRQRRMREREALDREFGSDGRLNDGRRGRGPEAESVMEPVENVERYEREKRRRR